MTPRQYLIGLLETDTEVLHGLSDRRWDRSSVMVFLLMDWGSYHGIWPTVLCVQVVIDWLQWAHPDFQGQVEYLSVAADNTASGGNIVVSAGVPIPQSRTEDKWPLVSTTCSTIVGFRRGNSDSAMAPACPEMATLSNRKRICTSGQVTGPPLMWWSFVPVNSNPIEFKAAEQVTLRSGARNRCRHTHPTVVL